MAAGRITLNASRETVNGEIASWLHEHIGLKRGKKKDWQIEQAPEIKRARAASYYANIFFKRNEDAARFAVAWPQHIKAIFLTRPKRSSKDTPKRLRCRWQELQ